MRPEPPELPRTLGVVGLGLMGASLARSFRSACPGARVVAVEPDRRTREAALVDGVADEALEAPGDELGACELVVLCTPLEAILSLMAPVSARMANGAVLTDVGGVKEAVVEAAHSEVRGPVHFVGAHPMFGGASGGYAAARADRWSGGVVAVCVDGADERAVGRVASLHTALGAEVVVCTAAEHDEAAAIVSHVPYLVASALALTLDDAPPLAHRLAGAGLRDVLRLAGFRYEVQGEVARQNRLLGPAAKHLGERLGAIVEALASDPPAARALLNRARARKERLG